MSPNFIYCKIPPSSGCVPFAINLLIHGCNSFREHRGIILAGVNDVLEACGYSEGSDINMLQLILYRNTNFHSEANKLILNQTIKYISETERLWLKVTEIPEKNTQIPSVFVCFWQLCLFVIM